MSGRGLRDFLLALQFLTRIPVPVSLPFDAAAQARSLYWYPLVGLLIGALLWLAATILPAGMTSAVAVVALWALITGGLHLDGLADAADAWSGGAGDRERTLAIMKDPASGPIGVMFVVLVLLMKFAATTDLLAAGEIWPLLLAPALGRSAVLALLATTPYVREQGIGASMSERLSPTRLLWLLAAVLVIALVWAGPAVVLAVSLLVIALRALMLRRLGGVTGDTLGAAVELVEAAMLALAVWFMA